jgi:hypothetical protein
MIFSDAETPDHRCADRAYLLGRFPAEAVGGSMGRFLPHRTNCGLEPAPVRLTARFLEGTFVEHAMDERAGSGQSREYAWQV